MAGNSEETEENKLPLSGCLVSWRGFLELGPHRRVRVVLRLISGSSSLPGTCIRFYGDPTPVLQLQGTMRLGEVDTDHINTKTQDYDQHSILIGLPGAEDEKSLEIFKNAQDLKTRFVDYLLTRRAVAFAHLRSYLEEQDSFSLHVFPHCLFSEEIIRRLVPQEFSKLYESAYLLFILTKNSPDE